MDLFFKEILKLYKNPFFMAFIILGGFAISISSKIISSYEKYGFSFFTSDVFLFSLFFVLVISIGMTILWYFGKKTQEQIEKQEEEEVKNKEDQADARERYKSVSVKKYERYKKGDWIVEVTKEGEKWMVKLYKHNEVIAEREL